MNDIPFNFVLYYAHKSKVDWKFRRQQFHHRKFRMSSFAEDRFTAQQFRRAQFHLLRFLFCEKNTDKKTRE